MARYELLPIDGRKSFYGKAIVEDNNGEKSLFSYNTLVVKVSGGKVTLFEKWDFSATTVRHVRAFLLGMGLRANNKADIAKQYE